MIKIEANSLEDAYAKAAQQLNCSITEMDVEVIQQPKRGLMQKLFKKNAIIVANCKVVPDTKEEQTVAHQPLPDETEVKKVPKKEEQPVVKSAEVKKESVSELAPVKVLKHETAKAKTFIKEKISRLTSFNETILPQSFSTAQEEDQDRSTPAQEKKQLVGEKEKNSKRYDYAKKSTTVTDGFFEEKQSVDEIAVEVGSKLNALFKEVCFEIDDVKVSAYDESTLLIEFSGKDAALLIGKEGYRYKALSYMLFNWINAKYQVQLRLEIAEFLKNQEEAIGRYLVGVYENVDRDGRAQTKILDGVLVQIALRELRNHYPDKYVAVRSTRDGSKYIIINDYNEY